MAAGHQVQHVRFAQQIVINPGQQQQQQQHYKQPKSPLIGIPVQHVGLPQQQHPQQKNHQIIVTPPASQVIGVGDYAYNPNDFLGRGAFGAVYRGYARNAADRHQPVAIKVISKRNMPLAATKEARIHQQLQHENLVRLLQIKDTPSNLYLIMEYCTGDLSELLPPSPGAYFTSPALLASREAFLRDIVRQLVAGLQALKAKAIVHRDLKPQNILLNYQQSDSNRHTRLQIKIADFGVSRFLPCGAMAATFCGTVAYMAPEVMLGQPYDCQADLWSLGVIIFQLLTGKMPFPQVDELSLHALKAFYTKIGGLPKADVHRNVSSELTSMLCKLIKCSATERIGLEKLAEHAFIHRGVVQQQQLKPSPPPAVVVVRHRSSSDASAGSGNLNNNNYNKKFAYAQYCKMIK